MLTKVLTFTLAGTLTSIFDLISLPGLTLPKETNDIPENLKKIIRVKASRPLVDKNEAQFKRRTFHVPNLIPIWVDPND